MPQESKAIRKLQDKGYTIVVSNPFSTNFSVKYTVYKQSNRLEGTVIYVDSEGNELHGNEENSKDHQ